VDKFDKLPIGVLNWVIISMSKITIKSILEDKFEEFWEKLSYRLPKDMREHIFNVVQKSLHCGDISKGYAEYMCMECGESVKVGFTCKSKFCVKCGRLYTLKWVDKQQENMLNVAHRHSVFTIPEELRNYFFKNRDMLKDLMDGVYQVIDYWYKTHKGKSYEVGVITVIHTFGRDLKWNPHVHALVTEGAINNKYKWWKPVEYVPYEYLRKSWQKTLLDIIKKYFKDWKTKKLISVLYRKYKDGFYVNADRAITDMRKATKYIGRYLARAAIAEYRIESYDGESVTFWYEDHDSGEHIKVTLDVLTFIGKLVQQIHKKGFKCVRRYGLYSRKKNALAKEIIHLYRFVKQLKISDILNRKNKQEKKSWKQRIIETFNRNPLECRKCKREMELWKIWHDDYGLIYDIRESNYKEVKSDGSNRRILLRTKSNRERTYVQISMPQVRLRRMGTSICGR
jgi:hypothetical protein